MSDADQPFSFRNRFQAPAAEITVREDAPDSVREAVTMLGYRFGYGPKSLRSLVCEVLLTRPDPGNWSDDNVQREVSRLIDDAPWFRVYDLAEVLYADIAREDFTATKADGFAQQLNAVFREHGVGWEMVDGKLIARGSEAFAVASKAAIAEMTEAGKLTAANEVHEALTDISRRPADVTGAIRHAMAALECVARDVTGDNDTLGKLVSKLGVPPPLDSAVTKLWGFASEQGRHIREGCEPRFEEAELVVTVASALSVYLVRADRARRSL